MDRQIDDFITYCTRWTIQWSLIAWNTITNWWDAGCEYGVRMFRALEAAHHDDLWVFYDPNTTPFCVKSSQMNVIPDNALTYTPSQKLFLLHNRIIPTPQQQRFHLVTAELEVETGQPLVDVNEIFHSVIWKGLAAPSLVEIIVLKGVLSNRPYSLQQISGMTLHIMDENADTHVIPLSSTIATRRFAGWT